MKRWWAAILPNRIGGQVLFLVVVSVVLTQAANFGYLAATNQSRQEEGQLRIALGTFLAGVRMIASAQPDDWPKIATIVRRTEPGIGFSYDPNADWQAKTTGEPGELSFIARDLGPGFAFHERQAAGDSPDTEQISVLLPNKVVVSARLTLPNLGSRWPLPAWSLFTFAIVFLPLIFVWVAWTLSRRLRRFARAAEDYSLEGPHESLPETGPEELQQLARALNRMRDRITGLLTDRTRMLSAIGHDLRTPITRLRLKAEFIEDDRARLDILRDLDRMNRMVNSALTYIRDGLETEHRVPIDLGALLRTVSDNFTDVGEKVSYEGDAHLNVRAQPDALVRAVENLVENALKYGSEAVLRSGRADPATIFIEVEDDGVGIAEEQRQAMLEPFVRGDAARNGTVGGFGLGLSITASIARAHGGQLVLASGSMGGLLARLTLPANDEETREAAQ
jgi:signal transduction histidine kinase